MYKLGMVWLQRLCSLLWVDGMSAVYFETLCSSIQEILWGVFSVQRYVKDKSMDIPQQQTTVHLQTCIELFTTVETLEEENPW